MANQESSGHKDYCDLKQEVAERVITKSAMGIVANAFADEFDNCGAINFCVARFGPDYKGRMFDVHVQLMGGECAHDLALKYQAAILNIAKAHGSINDIEEVPKAISAALALIPRASGGTLDDKG